MPRLFLLSVLLLVAGCASTSQAPAGPLATALEADGVVLTILQINDVYEITPVEGGNAGGLARVAGLLRQLEAENPNTIAVLAGDYLSPSALGTARVDGERLAGKQMVAVLNALGLDVAALGNHEFDVSESAFRQRMAESEFRVISGNARAAEGFAPFEGVDEHALLTVGPDRIRVGLVSTVLPSTVKDYVAYGDLMDELEADAAELAPQSDVLIGLTHLAFADDARAAATIPELDLVLGGHEHENVRAYRGADLTPILKADANARTVYVHHVRLGGDSREVTDVASTLVTITPETPEDPAVAAEVDRWVELAYAGFREGGFEPERVVVQLPEPLDGREGTIRTRQALLGTLIADGFRAAAGTDLAIFNGGSVRVDDVLTPGPFTEYDAIRVMPFGGDVVVVELPGRLLTRLLDQGEANAGTGGYLQRSGVGEDGGWTVDGAPIDADKLYRIATNDFLVSGRESGLDWFSVDAPEITQIGTHGDVRKALIEELKRRYDG